MEHFGQFKASLVSQSKESPCNAGDARFDPLVGEDPLEEEMTTYSSVLAWKIPQIEQPGGL